jgi:farnesyl-diphosphate farnesyltransferase
MISEDKKFYKKRFPRTREEWLKKVSRTFALSIRILPGNLRSQIGHSYLLCRLLDTIEDASTIPVKEKKISLDMAIRSIRTQKNILASDKHFLQIALRSTFKPAEKTLLTNSHFIFEGIYFFEEPVKQIIEKWSVEMAMGMQKYCFGNGKNEKQLKSLNDLDQYIYYVAGTVGKLLTRLISQEQFKISQATLKQLDSRCINFGKALQLVNIIKDSRSDKLEGRCYVPRELMNKYGLNLKTFFNPIHSDKITNLYQELIEKAEQYLNDAAEYIKFLPKRLFRYRLGCTWTVLFAYKTLYKLRKVLPEFIRDSSTFKIQRKEVKKILRSSLGCAFSNRSLMKQIEKVKHCK